MKKDVLEGRHVKRVNAVVSRLRAGIPDSFIKKNKIKDSVLDELLTLLGEIIIARIDESADKMLTNYVINRDGDALQTVLYFQEYLDMTTDEILKKIQQLKDENRR